MLKKTFGAFRSPSLRVLAAYPDQRLSSSANNCVIDAESASKRLQIGTVLECRRTFSNEDIESFVTTTGDSNPIHTDCKAAKASGFSGHVLPGVLCASLFPALIGSTFPGAIYLSQTLKFRKPALAGEPVTARITVDSVSGSRVAFKTECLSDYGTLLVDGVAVALIREQQ